MQAAALIGTYLLTALLTAIVLQGVGFLISRAVDYEWPAAGTLTFLILFLSAYGFAWPIAVRIGRMADPSRRVRCGNGPKWR
jgi:hypothetical protein